MNQQLENVRKAIDPLRQQIIDHKVYSVINDIEDLKIFMQFHVYAVWDFMSLLKALQINLTCTSTPWFPVGSGDTRFLINEIVVGEESDIDSFGTRKSHFELYLDAMQQSNARPEDIQKFLTTLKETGDLNAAYSAAKTPAEAQNFVNSTFKAIADNKSHVQAAVFTFGREDLIPHMFHSIISDIYKESPESISIFKYYLERHIEVDGDHHSHLALEMTSNLCGNNEQYWKEAEEATIESLQRRIDLWDGVYKQIMENKAVVSI